MAARSAQLADPIVAAVTGLDHEGHGVARVDGKVVFIDGALPGETVRYRPRRARKRYDTGSVLEVLVAAPERVPPACGHFGMCGGCSLQHMNAEAQIHAKQRVLRENLAHIARVEPDTWAAPVTGPAWGYRRKARLGARLVPKKGGMLVGFRERRSRYLTGLRECHTLDPRFATQLPALTALLESLACAEHIPQVEVAAGDAQAALVFRNLVPLTHDDRARLIAFGRATGLQIHLQPAGPDSVAPLWPPDPPPLGYRLPAHDIEIRFAPTDFVQVNIEVNRRMVDQALDWLDVRPGERVLDLFSGLGNFTLPLARRAGEVVGVEAGGALVAGAAANAHRNGLHNVRVIEADLFIEDGPAPWGGQTFERVLLDPPRSGAIAVLKRLPAPGPARIVYVSCNPATLARDAQYLVHNRGYRLRRAGVLDMFPQTSHVESMALFERAP